MTTQKIIDTINSFIPFSEDDPENDNESFLYRLMMELEGKEDAIIAIEPIFKLMEKYPTTDFGSPGPLVNTLESYPGQYENYLFESLNRKPAVLTVWMFNRIINAEKNIIIRQNMVDRLQALSAHSLVDKETKDDINYFVNYQKQILNHP